MTGGASEFRGSIGVAREDITPPPGIYARCWGAAKHDVAEGVHRPLTLTCMTFEGEGGGPLVLIGADLMSWRSREDEWEVRGAVVDAVGVDESRVMFCLSHTHAAPSLRREDEERHGGQLIAGYRKRVADAAAGAARRALETARRSTLTWRYGRCDLAANRDLVREGRAVCGFNPDRAADDTLLVGRVVDAAGRVVGTIVNYACHPTTLAWENRLISPDYVGAMREVVEGGTGGAPCLFLQGASGDLAPAEQYTGDVRVADRHGRRLGYAVLATLDGMGGAGKRLAYQGVVESGAPLGLWGEEDVTVNATLAAARCEVELRLKAMPSVAEIDAQWRACVDPVQKERLWRRRGVRRVVGDGEATQVPVWAWRVGDALLIGHPNEAYSPMQTRLRQRFAGRAVAVVNLVNGSAGYLPTDEAYETGAYSAVQTPFERGSLARLIGAVEECAGRLL